MIKKTLALVCVFTLSLVVDAQMPFTATYSFANVTSSSGTLDPTPPPVAAGIVCGSFVAIGQTAANPNAAGRFSFTRQPLGGVNGATSLSVMTGSLSPSQFYEVTLTPENGYFMSLDSIKFSVQRSATGIRSFALRTSVDGFANNVPAAVMPAFSSSLSVVNGNEFFVNNDVAYSSAAHCSVIHLTDTTGCASVTIRFYSWNAETNAGTFSIDNVTFKGSVTPIVAATAVTVCVGSTATLTASGADTYTWNTGANTNSLVVSPASTTNYTVTGETLTGCTGTAAAEVLVISSPTISVNSASVCAGKIATLAASGVTTYTWSNGATTNSIVVSPTVTTTYTVNGELSGCASLASNTTAVNMLPQPTIVITSTNSGVFCANHYYLFTASGANTYSWSTGNSSSTALISPTLNANIFTFSFTVTGTNNEGCVSSTQHSVQTAICEGIAEYTELPTTIAPNPAKENVELLFATNVTKNISISNVFGQIVYTQNTNEQKVNVNVSSFSQGIYFVTITTDNQKAVKKLIVE